MKESGTDEPLIDKETKQDNVDVLDDKKDNKDKPV